MMSRSRGLLAASLALLVFVSTAPVHAGEADEASADILLETLRANKKALVAVNLGLKDEEARAFWPVYDRYQQELGAIQDRLLSVIDDYKANFGSTTDAKAMQLVEDYLAVEQNRAAVRRSYLAPISKALPGLKVMRFYQIENKVEAVMRYDLAATIPVVEQAASAK